MTCGHVGLSAQPATRISGIAHSFPGNSYGFKAKYCYKKKTICMYDYLKVPNNSTRSPSKYDLFSFQKC